MKRTSLFYTYVTTLLLIIVFSGCSKEQEIKEGHDIEAKINGYITEKNGDIVILSHNFNILDNLGSIIRGSLSLSEINHTLEYSGLGFNTGNTEYRVRVTYNACGVSNSTGIERFREAVFSIENIAFIKLELIFNGSIYSNLILANTIYYLGCNALVDCVESNESSFNVDEEIQLENELRFTNVFYEFSGILLTSNKLDTITVNNLNIEFPIFE